MIASAEIEVVEFLRFLSDYTGLPVVYDSGDKRIIEGKITLAAPMHDVDAKVVKAILEANGFHVRVERLASGKEVIHVEVSPGRR